MRLFDPAIDEEETILQIRATCLENLANGVIITTWSNEGTSLGQTVTMATRDLLNATTVYLKEKNPELYGHFISKTRPFFTY